MLISNPTDSKILTPAYESMQEDRHYELSHQQFPSAKEQWLSTGAVYFHIPQTVQLISQQFRLAQNWS